MKKDRFGVLPLPPPCFLFILYFPFQVLMAGKVMELAVATEGKEALAIEAFANALLKIPTIIADNAGYDSADLVARIRAKHNQGGSSYTLDTTRVNGDRICEPG